jgi:hypothetical protein
MPGDKVVATGLPVFVFNAFPMWEPPLCGDQSGHKGPSHIAFIE